jgi:hypothetical protein
MDVNDCKRFMADTESVLSRMVAESGAFIASHRERSERRSAALAEFKQNEDTMFANVFQYRKENFHSEMLRQFLDPLAPDIGDRRFLRVFLELLERINPAIKTGGFGERVTVEREAGGAKADGRIDLLVCDDTRAVIIENKINCAIDQPNQLAKYVKLTQSRGKEVAAVVYIPLFEGGEPPLEGYDEEWQTFVPEITQKLAVVPAVNRLRGEKGGGGGNDLADGFIGECLKLDGLKDRQQYLLSQYAKLLRTMEGESKMTEAVDKEFIKEFYKDKKSIETAEHINDVWDDRERLLGGIVRQTLWDKLKSELGFYDDEEEKYSLFKDVSDDLYVAFYSDPDPEDCGLHLGFWYGQRVRRTVKTALEEALDAVLPEQYFEGAYDWEDPEGPWLTKRFYIGEYKEPIPEIEKYFIDCCKALEKAAKALQL